MVRRSAYACSAKTSSPSATPTAGSVSSRRPARTGAPPCSSAATRKPGLRCVYHGWKFDTTGACVDMPSEPAESNFKNKVRIGAYPTHESGGVVFTYMGPAETMPAFRDLGTEAIPKDEWRAGKQFTYCNWIQAMEGNIDTSHISWLHQWHELVETPDDGTDTPGYPTNMKSWYLWSQDRAPRLEVQDTEYGFRYAGIRTTPNGHTHVRVTAYIMPYQTIVAGLPVRAGGTTFVPRDDETCWRFSINSGMLTAPSATSATHRARRLTTTPTPDHEAPVA